jgi:hypothetical protein
MLKLTFSYHRSGYYCCCSLLRCALHVAPNFCFDEVDKLDDSVAAAPVVDDTLACSEDDPTVQHDSPDVVVVVVAAVVVLTEQLYPPLDDATLWQLRLHSLLLVREVVAVGFDADVVVAVDFA